MARPRKSRPNSTSGKPTLVVREAAKDDISSIIALCRRVYPNSPPYTREMLQGHINNYHEGQFVAVYEGRVVGYCATIRINERMALQAHTWRQITGNGFGATHQAKGEYLYGMEVFVDPDYRGLRIGERFYRERKRLCQHYRLKGIVFGGRLPSYAKRQKKYPDVHEYVSLVQKNTLRDPTLTFQIRQGFEVLGVLKNYLPSDAESAGYAVHLIWRNPEAGPVTEPSSSKRKPLPSVVRVATVQYEQRRIQSFEDFEQIVTYFVDVVSDYKADFVVFPEMFTMQLLSLEHEPLKPAAAIDKLTDYTEPLKQLFNRLALRFNINIIAGSHPTKVFNNDTPEGSVQNMAFICLRDGSVHEQAKIHPTPSERYWWNIQGGSKSSVIDTDCGPIGVMICYDSEFPELSRHLIDQGANILFVPFCTDVRQAYLRVRYSCQARAVENQCYVVMSGNVGNLPMVENMDVQYAQSCILTPCDFLFARDGIAADTTPNVETMAIADLHLDSLHDARNSGSVRNIQDRRHDLYSVTWHSHSD